MSMTSMTFTDGQVLTTDEMNEMADNVYSARYSSYITAFSRTTTYTSTATSLATASNIFSTDLGPFSITSLTSVMIEVSFPRVAPPAVSAATMSLYLYDTTNLTSVIVAQWQTPSAATVAFPVVIRQSVTPASNSTYNLRAVVSSGTGTFTAGTGGDGLVRPITLWAWGALSLA